MFAARACVCVLISSEPSTSLTAPSRFFYSQSRRGRLRALKLGHLGVAKRKGWTLAAKLPGPRSGRGAREAEIDGLGTRRLTSGKVRTVRRSSVAGGDIFGQHAGVTAPDCQPPLQCGCRGRGQGGGRRASRLRPCTFSADRKRECARDGGVERSQEPGGHAAFTGLNKN